MERIAKISVPGTKPFHVPWEVCTCSHCPSLCNTPLCPPCAWPIVSQARYRCQKCVLHIPVIPSGQDETGRAGAAGSRSSEGI